ncbi:TIGR03087 family PEP-CTERM/XrtA system glycosyltransferase [Massilia antarctica]|uniref:TIGR03087 family PEP-CTERM/XrtA system glycosyltransferase n=1 Tax=Massilia antarctica TaxID=2765360 RepID=UPI0006BB5C72|nr:TIGR03087 family PEP-CTERM/XrtA system glycosyltransferase [Massilia sp. H27-R4]CUI06522.1 FIG137776: Glycosyltransferase [Janthinobacterium sp. CG23_2]CUU30308.1 FIG137776: Glycosyltransferase [Janthinobacterium sp. CG23_2]
MDDLLLLIHRIPYPPNKGDKIRSYHLLKHLARYYRVHLGTFVDDPDDWQHLPRVQALCASSHFARLDPTRARVRSLGALLANRSLSLDYYRDKGLREWVGATMAANKVERILVFSSPMAQYAEAYRQARRVVDFCDVDSDKWRQYAAQKSWPMSMLYAHEARQLLRYERKVALDSAASLFVSAPEAALFRQLAPESAERTGFFNNGVDTDYFTPHADYPNPFIAGQQALVFCGAMDYWPNVDAVTWFAREIFPAVLARHPAAQFVIVGARPAQEVLQLAALPGVSVTGTVPDVRPYVAHAALCVAPLRIARGIQNKVLEAMSMAKTVVVSPQALEGIAAEPGRDLLLALDAPQFGAAIGQALDAPRPDMGRAARHAVETQYGWSSNLAPVVSLLEQMSVESA